MKKGVFLLSVFLFAAHSCWADIAFDAAASASASGFPATVTVNLTVGAGANRGMGVCVITVNPTTVAAPQVEWDKAGADQNVTEIGTKYNPQNLVATFVYWLKQPVSGAKILTVTPSVVFNASIVSVSVASYTGTDQSSTPIDGSGGQNFNSMTSGGVTVTGTSAVDKDWGLICGGGSNGPMTSGAGTTQRTEDHSNVSASVFLGDSGANLTPAGSYALALGAPNFTFPQGWVFFVKPAVASTFVANQSIIALGGP